MMRKFLVFFVFLMILSLSACVLSAPGADTPAADSNTVATAAPEQGGAGGLPEVEVTDQAVIAGEPTKALGSEGAQPSATQPVRVENTAPPPQPTPLPPTAAPTPTPLPPTTTPQVQVALATATQLPVSTAAATAVSFEPVAAFGDPDYENDMDTAYWAEWAQAETQLLPDNRNIRLQFKDGRLYVTGKRMDFSTWWFSYHYLYDFYAEMTFDTESCSGGDTYGIIFRGPPHKAGLSYGYVAAFTCDGRGQVFRLDDATPYRTATLLEEKQFAALETGSNAENVIGVRAESDHFVIVVNGEVFGEFDDDEFSKGRVGVFVMAAETDDYTYRLTDFAYWKLNEDE